MRSITPQAKPEYVQAIHKEAESVPSEGATSLSGLSDLMQREAMPPRDEGDEAPLPAAQRAHRPAAATTPQPSPSKPEWVAPESSGSETGQPAKASSLERLRRLRSRRARRVTVIAGVAGIAAILIGGVVLAVVLWPTQDPEGGGEPRDDAGFIASPGSGVPPVDDRGESDTGNPATPLNGTKNEGSGLPDHATPDTPGTPDTAGDTDAGDDIAALMGINGEDPIPDGDGSIDAAAPPPPVDPSAARILLVGGWQRIEPPRAPEAMKPERPGNVRVTTAQQDFQPDKGIVVSVDFVNRSSRTAAVVDFSAAALSADSPLVLARRRAAFALLEAGETHTVTMPLPARYTHDRLRVDAWVDESVDLTDAWRALDPRIEEQPDPQQAAPSIEISLTNGNVQPARSVLASVQGLDAQGRVMRDVLLHWKIDAAPMDRVTLNAVLPPRDEDQPAASQYTVRAYLVSNPEPPPGVFTSPVEPMDTDRSDTP